MMLKRTLLVILIFLTLLFSSYQLWLTVMPLNFISTKRKYISLVYHYQFLKIERLILEEQYALLQAKAKLTKVAAISAMKLMDLNPDRRHPPTPTSNPPPTKMATYQPVPDFNGSVSLSLQETKTFEQLEAYVSNNKPPHKEPLTADEKCLLEAPPNTFTLQLMGVRDSQELTHFVNDNHLQDAHIFHTYYLNQDWYVLVSGSYKNHTEALKAINSLPLGLKELKPWIRQLSSVQKAIQLYR
jgi:septal ring-binding cell division protein DamX